MKSINYAPRLSMIVAVDEDDVIGLGKHLPWKCKDDMQWFVSKTKHKAVVMGGNTRKGIYSPLKDRTNIVLTKSIFEEEDPSGWLVTGGFSYSCDLDGAIRYCKYLGVKELVIIGGASLYQQFFDLCDKIYVTRIFGKHEGDVKLNVNGITELLNQSHKDKIVLPTGEYVVEEKVDFTGCQCYCFNRVKQ